MTTRLRRTILGAVALLVALAGAQAIVAGTDLREGPRALLRSVLAGRRSLTSSSREATRRTRLAEWAAQRTEAGGVAFVGDSLAARFPRELLDVPAASFMARGLPGETVPELHGRLAETLERAPSTLIVQTGTNDAIRGTAVGSILREQAGVLRASRAALPRGRIVVLSLPPASPWRVEPAVVRAVNAGLLRLTAEVGGTFIDTFAALARPDGTPAPGMSTDGVHLTRAGYERVAPTVRGAVAA